MPESANAMVEGARPKGHEVVVSEDCAAVLAAVREVQARLLEASADSHALESDYVYGYARGLKKAVEELDLMVARLEG